MVHRSCQSRLPAAGCRLHIRPLPRLTDPHLTHSRWLQLRCGCQDVWMSGCAPLVNALASSRLHTAGPVGLSIARIQSIHPSTLQGRGHQSQSGLNGADAMEIVPNSAKLRPRPDEELCAGSLLTRRVSSETQSTWVTMPHRCHQPLLLLRATWRCRIAVCHSRPPLTHPPSLAPVARHPSLPWRFPCPA